MPRPQEKVHTVQPPPEDDQTVAGVAALLASAAGTAAILAGPEHLLAPFGFAPMAIRAALGLAGRGSAAKPRVRFKDTSPDEGGKQILRHSAEHDLYLRAAYFLNATHRIDHALSTGETIRAALADESVFYRAHERARDGRRNAATRVATAAQLFGPLLGWYHNPMLNNEPECLAASGHNFYADRGTVIGLPGAVHPNCGCYPGPPHEAASLVNDVLGNVVRFSPNTTTHKLKHRKGA